MSVVALDTDKSVEIPLMSLVFDKKKWKKEDASIDVAVNVADVAPVFDEDFEKSHMYD